MGEVDDEAGQERVMLVPRRKTMRRSCSIHLSRILHSVRALASRCHVADWSTRWSISTNFLSRDFGTRAASAHRPRMA